MAATTLILGLWLAAESVYSKLNNRLFSFHRPGFFDWPASLSYLLSSSAQRDHPELDWCLSDRPNSSDFVKPCRLNQMMIEENRVFQNTYLSWLDSFVKHLNSTLDFDAEFVVHHPRWWSWDPRTAAASLSRSCWPHWILEYSSVATASPHRHQYHLKNDRRWVSPDDVVVQSRPLCTFGLLATSLSSE